jgi:DNA-binding HxlR family transcriptional regulator
MHRLVHEGIPQRVLSRDRPERYEYRLTQNPRDLLPTRSW